MQLNARRIRPLDGRVLHTLNISKHKDTPANWPFRAPNSTRRAFLIFEVNSTESNDETRTLEH